MHVGVDLAWNTRARTGPAVVDASGKLARSTSVRTDAEIDDWLGRFDSPLMNVAVDAPLVVTNPTGMRECERLIGKSFGRFDASCHASHRGKTYMDPSALQVYGGTDGGYIIAPPPPTPAHTLRVPTVPPKPAQRHTAEVSPGPSISFWVDEVPATSATAREWPWRAAVSAAAAASGGEQPLVGRFAVELEFVLPAPTMKGQGWDLDNLITPTIDALAPEIGVRPVAGPEQADDEPVNRIVASKPQARDGEVPGARIVVSVLPTGD